MGKVALSANKLRKLTERLGTIKKQKNQAVTDYRRGEAELNANEPQGGKLMDRARKKFNRLSIEEEKIRKQIDGD